MLGIPKKDLVCELNTGHGIELYRVTQLWQWLYKRSLTPHALSTLPENSTQISLLDEATLLPRDLREWLDARYVVDFGRCISESVSQDDTRKFLCNFDDGISVECVYIPTSSTQTICLSSQCGCSLNCRFCHTGTQKLERNLKASEIIGQFILARRRMLSSSVGTSDEFINRFTNVVFMGQGEPLYNWKNVRNAIRTLTDIDGFHLSTRRITVSTAGVVPAIHQVAELGVNLAISLHATTNDVRDELIPLNKTFPLETLMQACRSYPSTRKITFEYVMLKGVNDSITDARQLIRMLKGICSHVNLIPFNPWPGAPYECSSLSQIVAFSEFLFSNGIDAPIRRSRGSDILAACGQLKSSHQLKQDFVERQNDSQNPEFSQHQQKE